jgi:hypothetical protein
VLILSSLAAQDWPSRQMHLAVQKQDSRVGMGISREKSGWKYRVIDNF